MTISLEHRKETSRHGRLLVLLLCLSLPALTAADAQKRVMLTSNEGDDVAQLRKDLAKSTQLVVDTTFTGLQRHVVTIAGSISKAVSDAKKQIAALTDILIRSAQDSLDASRQDSLRFLGKSLELQFASHESSMRSYLDARSSNVMEVLRSAKGRFSICTDCEERSSFDERLADFKDLADSLVSGFHDTTVETAEERRDLLADALDAARDSLLDVRDDLVDHRLSDIDAWRYEVSRLVLSSAFASHNAYRGRDNGLLQQSYAPSVMYRHSSGMSIQGSTYWMKDEGNRWDNFQLTGGYEFRFSEVVGGSLSYTHFWFNDSSKSELSVFTDNAQGGFTFDWPVLSVGALGSISFGTASEFTLTTSISHSFEIPLTLYNRVTVSPSFSWVLGQQNSELTSLLTTKAKGRRAGVITSAQTKSTITFSILDYELSIPATIELGPVTIAPSATYIIPFNVLDASTRKSFINLELGIFLTIR